VNEQRDQFTLFYYPSSPLSSEETSCEERFDDVVGALSRALQVIQDGGNPTHLIFDDAVIFSGNDLREIQTYILKYISENVGLLGLPAAEVVHKTLAELLIKQLVKTVKFAHEHFGAVAVYASMLEELYKAADEAILKKDLGLLFTITGKLAFWNTPSESDVKRWGKDFLQAYRRDSGWLHDAKAALTKIEAAAKELEIDRPRSAELRTQILKLAEDGLITRI
jgi:hypothetical protein